MGSDKGERTPGATATGTEDALATVAAGAALPTPAAGDDDEAAPLPNELPERDPTRYERVAEHARGGLGQIWRATDRDLGRTVALKELLRPSRTGEARFVREALLTARLEHPSIVAVHDAGRTNDGHPFYTMKMVAGRSLGEVVRDTTLFDERLALLPHAIAVADAVAYAHSHRVIHRDLKPANVLVGEFGETVVVDWGLAKELGDDATAAEVDAGPYRASAPDELTRAGSVLGTPAYMAPEQARGEDVDERADVYSLGALLYHLLAGAPPYRDAPSADVLSRVLDGPPRDLAEVTPEAPADLLAIVRKAMARAPGHRYPTARELVADLRRFQTGKLVSVHGYSLAELARRWYQRHRTPVWVGALALVILAVVGAVSVRRVVSARALADQRLTESLLDRGRRALLAEDYRASASYLSQAYVRGARGVDVRMMLSLATRPLEAEQATLVHASKIWEVNYSDDGSLLLVTAEAGAHLWDGRTGVHLRSFRGHTAQLRVARFGPEADFVVSGGDDRTARIWRTADATELVALPHDAAVHEVAVSPDGKQIATATAIGTVRIWSRGGRLEHTLEAHQGRIWRLLFSPDGTLLASAGVDGAVVLWNPSAGEPVHTLTGHTSQVRNLSFSHAGNRLLSVGVDRIAIVWDTTTGAKVTTLTGHASPLIGGRFSPDDSLIVTSGVDPYVNIWNATDGSVVQVLHGHTGAVYWSSFTSDGQAVVTVSWDGTARVWDASTGTEQLVMAGHEGPAVWGALSADGATLATSSWDGTVRMWDTARRTELARFRGDGSTIEEVAVDTTGRLVLGCSSAGHAFLGSRGAAVRKFTIGHPLASCAFSVDGRRFATAAYDGAVGVWDAGDGRKLYERAPTGPGPAALSVAFHPSGDRLAVGNEEGGVTLWDLAADEQVALRAHREFVLGVQFSSDGQRLLTAGGDHRVKVWDLSTPTPTPTLDIEAHDYVVSRARFSPDGRRIATASYDGTARVWDARTGKRLQSLAAHAGEVRSLSFHPTGDLLVTASTDVATIWDLDTQRALARFRGHAGGVVTVAFSPDGSFLATGGDDGVIKLWDTRMEERSPEEVARAVACLIADTRRDEPADPRTANAGCSRVIHHVLATAP